MKLKHTPIGSKVVCCGATAEVLKHGELGTRVNVLTLKKVDFPGFVTGFQIWSGESTVELITGYAPGEPYSTKSAVSTQIDTMCYQ